MKKEAQQIDTMKMVREIRDRLGKLRRTNPEEYFRQINESGRKLLARRRGLHKKPRSHAFFSSPQEHYVNRRRIAI